MAAHTICMYMKVDGAGLDKAETWRRLEAVVVKALGGQSANPTVVSLSNNCEHDKVIIIPGNNGSHAVMRVYSSGLITLDIQHLITSEYKTTEDSPYNMEFIRMLENDIKHDLSDLLVEMNSLYAPIRRGQTVWPYAVSADDRILEMDYDELIFEKKSRYQTIRIFHSREFGNVLFLDGDAMLGESDLIYTRSLLCDGGESYSDKEILILGGGDGGLLHELLKEKPKMIMIEDCVKVLHDSIKSGKQYDYVINDLTEFPVEKAVKGFGYDLKTTSLITELSLKAIKPGGKVLARGNCWGAYDYREHFEREMRQLNCDFKRRDVFVPSFQETYPFHFSSIDHG
ncbi:hypothetical protein LSH36_251g01000 [Paralvinella palmiformis]|uniref:PABS domain-containing protein n=1 Tax=Paralvinella palmiformis TaxID=53620 RepID=A0AAD9JKQ4_9ANNE|nr:hypothetical protein LSH36_251g01000 [Paralvinella palmiformis]